MVGNIDAWAIQMNELYESLMKAGFTKKQALRLTGQAIHAHVMVLAASAVGGQ